MIPFVGTIHSLAFKLLGMGKGQTANDHLGEFCDHVRIPFPKDKYASAENIEGFWWVGDTFAEREIDALLRVLASMRHTGKDLNHAYERIPMSRQLATSPERMAWLAREYDLWKREQDLLDFEDMIEQGAQVPIPCKVLIADEVQDNSILLWKTLDSWAESPSVQRYYALGDAYQSLYQWAGASPDLFLNRPGRWEYLPTSHRLADDSAQYARKILMDAGYENVPKWQGVGDSEPDGTTFYLARTHALTNIFEEELKMQGVPYKRLRGWSPWEGKDGQAYRACMRAERTGWVLSAESLKTVVEQLKIGLPRGAKTTVGKMGGEVSWPEDLFGGLTPERAKNHFTYSDYFNRVVARRGEEGMLKEPKVFISTVHGAKGLECDTTILADSWATLPARDLLTDEGRRAESLVAYVGATRHRIKLEIEQDFPGAPYPLP